MRGSMLRGRLAAWIALATAAIGAPACVDASHDADVNALGGEAPTVPRGPTHRSGQPCLVCHGGLGPASAQFVMAGTVYAVQGGNGVAPGAQVQIEDAVGSLFTIDTNEAGNFYIPIGQWSPTLPAQVVVTKGSDSQQMVTHIGRDGSCAGCHVQPPSPTSPGPVYVASGPLPEGGP